MGKRKRAVKRGPNKRERSIIEKRVAGESMRAIATEVGVSPTTVFSTLKRLEPQLVEALRLADYGLNKAVTKMVEMTEAKKTKFFAHKGEVIETKDVEDNTTRLQARIEMLRINAAYPATRTELGNADGQPLQIVVRNIGRPRESKPA